MDIQLRWLIPALAGAALLLFLLERFLPLRRPLRTLLPRLALNAVLSAIAFAVSFALIRPTVAAVMGSSVQHTVGLVPRLPLPQPVAAAVAFLLMDLSFYYWHRANHRLVFLWRLHNVHHVDPDLDLSTSFRFHCGEVALSVAFRAIQVTVIGVTVPVYAAYELIFQLNTMFHHTNVRLPIGVERVLNLVLVTPRMHGIHHSQVRDETNSNYSVVFCWWDRLHRTLRLNVPQALLVIGVPGYASPEDNALWSALAMPFRRQKDYWRLPDGSTAERDPAVLGAYRSRLEE